jgi:hypothetical protein
MGILVRAQARSGTLIGKRAGVGPELLLVAAVARPGAREIVAPLAGGFTDGSAAFMGPASAGRGFVRRCLRPALTAEEPHGLRCRSARLV